jgi:hypothetical protein
LNPIIETLKQGPVTVEKINELIASHTENPKHSDINNALLLHRACGAIYFGDKSHLQSVEVIKVLLDAYPVAAEVKDTWNRTPLHWALQQGASVEVIKMLLDAYPAAAELKDTGNNTPLHLALQQGASVEVIKMMLDACPAAAEVKDTGNNTPLHLALQQGASVEVIKMMLDACPAAAEVKDTGNNTPLHLALQQGASVSKGAASKSIDDILNTLGAKTQQNKTEEHLAEIELASADFSDVICAVCELGGDMICCDGQCLRSFHPKCIDLNEEDIPEDAPFLCVDCSNGIHRCFTCKHFELESELVKCSLPFCGIFFHKKVEIIEHFPTYILLHF